MISFIARRIGGTNPPADLDFDKIFKQECGRLAALMRMTIDRQGEPPGSFRPLAEKTKLARKNMRKGGTGKNRMLKKTRKTVGTKALISSGTMYNSIDVVETPRGAFVGVPRKTKAKAGGKKPYELALIHEYGKKIKYTVTREHLKMIRFVHAVLVPMWRAGGSEEGSGSSKGNMRIGGTMHITIPARPFLEPAFEAWAENVPHALAEHLIAKGYSKG